MVRVRISWPLAGLVALVQAGCRDAVAPQDQANDRIAIVNNAAALAARVTYRDDNVEITGSGVGYPATGTSDPTLSFQAPAGIAAFKLMLKAEVAPPSIDGQMLQATSVEIGRAHV